MPHSYENSNKNTLNIYKEKGKRKREERKDINLARSRLSHYSIEILRSDLPLISLDLQNYFS